MYVYFRDKTFVFVRPKGFDKVMKWLFITGNEFVMFHLTSTFTETFKVLFHKL